MVNYLLAIQSLWHREIKRFFRQKSRVIGALGTPLIFWIFIGSGFGRSFQAGAFSGREGFHYLHYFFPGTILLILFFTSVFSTFSLIQDRQEGFLQSVLVAPIPRSSLVLGKVLGGTTLAWFQAMIFLSLAPFIGLSMSPFAWFHAAFVIFLNAFMLTAFGFFMAWKINSIQGFHVVMNMFLMPCWFLSGAIFPADGAPVWIRFLMNINPLTYGLTAIRRAIYEGDTGLAIIPSQGLALMLLFIFCLLAFVCSVLVASERHAENVL